MATVIEKRLQSLADPDQAAILRRFFKTGPGEYGEGDRFLGLKVPVVRGVVKEFPAAGLAEALQLLHSPWHEVRLTALLIMVRAFEKGDVAVRKQVYEAYLKNSSAVNNWDLVDLSAPNIVGEWLLDKPRRKLQQLAKSRVLWERRIAIVATHAFIRRRDFGDTLLISGMLLGDKHDLIHKACGWMLREAGKRDEGVLDGFLCEHCTRMPRTMLRYAIERMDAEKRGRYMRGEVKLQGMGIGE